MRIKSLAQGENILMLGFEPSTSVSKIDILTTRPICSILISNEAVSSYSDVFLGLRQSLTDLSMKNTLKINVYQIIIAASQLTFS